ncbi:MAG: PEP-CTERM sorting domain-containing protein [Microcoleaceae cyanobacterium]
MSFDITSIFNNAITNGWSSLGIRLESATDPQGGAWTFDTFRLTTDNQGSNSIPEPSAVIGLLAVGLGSSLLKKKTNKV